MQMRLTLIVFATALALAPVDSTAQGSAPAATATVHYGTATTTIGEILADPAAKAIVDQYMPGVLSDPRIDKFFRMTLKQVQKYAPDIISDAKLANVDAAFTKLPSMK